jgi:GNAT superfamily N-acetyltransferase
MILVPDTDLREFNACHSPVDGKFCAGTGHRTHSEAFRKWFSGSVVVDRKGDPLVLYHGTPSDFMKFTPGGVSDPGKMPSGPAIWLSVDPEHLPAAHHIGGRPFKTGTNVIPVYARITKPLRVDDNNVTQVRKDMGLNSEFPLLITPATKKRLTSAGYDGVFYNSAHGREIVAFRSTQLKSAIANRGTFSRTHGSLVESEFTEFNPNHGPDGRFTSAVGAARAVFDAHKLNPSPMFGHGLTINAARSIHGTYGDAAHLWAEKPWKQVTPDPSTYLKVVVASVHPALQRRGVGKAMYLIAADEAKKKGWAGIMSRDTSRNTDSTRVWASLEKMGLARKTPKGYEL